MTERLIHAARRMADIAPFHVVEVMQRAQALEAQGRHVIHMEVGEPDFPTPQPMIEAATAFLQYGDVRYTPALGIPALREAIAGFYENRYGIRVGSERIVVTAGASGALLLALGALIDPGREVLLADPGYPCNRHFIRCFEGVAKSIAVDERTAYQPTAAQVDEAWSPATRAVLIASPANPTGTLIDPTELATINEVVRRHAGVLLVDEIYSNLSYGLQPRTALALGDDVLVMNSFSKYFGMTGWRLGWLVAPGELVRDVEKLAQNLFIAPSAPAQYAALAAFRPDTLAVLEARRSEFQKRRDYLLPALRALGFRIPAAPGGAFYIYADCAAVSSDAETLSKRLIEEAGVAITPGVDFGERGARRHVRFAYTTSLENLREGVQRIERFLRG